MNERGVRSFLLFALTSNRKARGFYESFAPDFTCETTITIDGNDYDDTGYGWTTIGQMSIFSSAKE